MDNTKKRLHIYTNLVQEGWSAKSLETGIGGSEEKLIELARELANKFDVTIYHNGEHGEFDGVHYRDHREFRPWMTRDIFISFKVRDVWSKSIGSQKKFHWTTEVEPEWKQYELDAVNRVITISKYHNSKMRPASDKIIPIYLWADLERLDRNKVDKEEGSMLYCSSFDRGLEELLVKWDEIKKSLKLKKLYITYGWDFMDNLIKFRPELKTWKENMIKLMTRDDIELVGRLSNDEMCKMYWKCQYWCLPLNNPDSELFCINAIKAQYCEAIPVVRRAGALQETVNKFIDFDSLTGQKVGQSTFDEQSIEENKGHAKKFSLEKAVEQWKELLV